MATIRKKGDKYQIQIRRKGFAPVSRSFHQRGDAEQWARHMDVKADRGELPAPIKALDRHTVKSILERYKREISIEKRSYCTEQHVLKGLTKNAFRLKMSPDVAKKAKISSAYVLLGRLKASEPIFTGGYHNKPTISKPHDYSSRQLIVNFSPSAIWLVNHKTGEIYKKIPID